jgi:hypothetical protein
MFMPRNLEREGTVKKAREHLTEKPGQEGISATDSSFVN